MYKLKIAKFLFACSLVIGILFGSRYAYAQVNLGPDTTICGGVGFNLNINSEGGSGQSIGPVTNVSLSDDICSQLIPLPFSFTFFGNTYNNCVIASNSYITFDAAEAGQYSPWDINNAAPSPLLPTNCIMAPYQDVNPSTNGVINYATVGEAPNRIFVVTFRQVGMFSCPTCFDNQVKLFEGTNEIQIHIGEKVVCSSWNDGVAIEGIQDATGTNGYIVPGRNYPTQWTAFQDAYSFIPTGPSTYDVNPVTFNQEPINSTGNGININWYSGSSVDSLIGTGTTLNITPTQTSDYVGELVFECNNTIYTDTITIYVSNTTVDTAVTEASCVPGHDGAIVANPNGSFAPYDYTWTDSTGTTILQENDITGSSAATGLDPGVYNLLVIDDLGCNIPFAFDVPGPPPLMTDTDQVNILCNGETNGSAMVSVTNGTAPFEYLWNDPASSTSSSISNLGAGLYIVTITDANSCILEESFVISEPMPLLLQMSSITDTCERHVGSAEVNVIGGVSPYGFLWTNNANGDTLTSNDTIADLLPEGSFQVKVIDNNGCADSAKVNVPNLPSVVAKFTFKVDPDGILNPEAVFTNGSLNAEFYDWDFGDNLGYSTEVHPIYLFPDDSARTYKVMLVAYDSYGCYDTAYGFVPIRPHFSFYVPNAFTPRRNEINDTFSPKGEGFDFDTYRMFIYDRWGNLVYQTNDMTKGWNGNSHTSGQPAPSGVYIYKIEIREPIGFEPKYYYGQVTLLWD